MSKQITTPTPTNYNISCLLNAIENGDTDIAIQLLQENPDLSGSSSLLHRAILLNRESIVYELLRRGANPNEPDLLQRSPLELAISIENNLIIQNLIAHGARVTQTIKEYAESKNISLQVSYAPDSSLWASNSAGNSSNENLDEEIIIHLGR